MYTYNKEQTHTYRWMTDQQNGWVGIPGGGKAESHC